MAKRVRDKQPPSDDAESGKISQELDALFETIASIWSRVPEKDLADLPSDFSRNLDKYLYGGDDD